MPANPQTPSPFTPSPDFLSPWLSYLLQVRKKSTRLPISWKALTFAPGKPLGREQFRTRWLPSLEFLGLWVQTLEINSSFCFVSLSVQRFWHVSHTHFPFCPLWPPTQSPSVNSKCVSCQAFSQPDSHSMLPLVCHRLSPITSTICLICLSCHTVGPLSEAAES